VSVSRLMSPIPRLEWRRPTVGRRSSVFCLVRYFTLGPSEWSWVLGYAKKVSICWGFVAFI
jgi:hypothetical protein